MKHTLNETHLNETLKSLDEKFIDEKNDLLDATTSLGVNLLSLSRPNTTSPIGTTPQIEKNPFDRPTSATSSQMNNSSSKNRDVIYKACPVCTQHFPSSELCHPILARYLVILNRKWGVKKNLGDNMDTVFKFLLLFGDFTRLIFYFTLLSIVNGSIYEFWCLPFLFPILRCISGFIIDELYCSFHIFFI